MTMFARRREQDECCGLNLQLRISPHISRLLLRISFTNFLSNRPADVPVQRRVLAAGL
jgi:hypothetical protein